MTTIATGFFAVPKAFKGRDAIHQNAALACWSQIGLNILLLGRDEGTAEAAERFGCTHFADIEYGKTDIPILSGIFEEARTIWPGRPLAYINSDILLPPSAREALIGIESGLAKAGLSSFLVVARRCNLPIGRDFIPGDDRTGPTLEAKMQRTGAWDGPQAMDFFMFSSDLFHDVPAFALGRGAWDNWLLGAAAKAGAAIVDASGTLPLVHALHGYQHANGGWQDIWANPETERNLRLANGLLKNLDQVVTHRFDGSAIRPVDHAIPFVPAGGEDAQAKRYAALALELIAERLQDGNEQEATDLAWLALDRSHRFTPGEVTGVCRESLRRASIDGNLDLLEDGFAERFLNSIAEITQGGREIWVWGAGGMAERLLALLDRHDIKISRLLSKDAPEDGIAVNALGMTAYPPQAALAAAEPQRPFVIIASMHKGEIGETLSAFGYKCGADYTF